MIGQVLRDKYHILREIGSSRVAEVYLAIDLSTNEVVTLKVLRVELTRGGQFLARFGQEAERVEKLSSRYALRLLDYGEQDGRAFIVQEYTPGRTLDQLLKDEGPLAAGRALDIARQVAQCLADADAVSVVHHDLHPSDIVIATGDAAKVKDFGLETGADLKLLTATGRVGTPHYLAPELASGETGDIRADVYALGVILFEMLTGRVPYLGDDAGSVVEKHLHEPVPSARSLKADVSEELDALLARCLAKDPRERPLPIPLVRAIADLLGEGGIASGVEGSLAGQTLGRYQLLERVGQGGMATVYKAYQPGLERHVAIKVLPRYFIHDPNFVARFEREAKAIARLDHPNILPVYDFGREGDLTYIVMRYVPDGALKDMLGQPLPLGQAMEIISQVAAALDYAHSQGMVHRDVKPSNVLMSGGNWALLSDFGLARMAESGIHLTGSGASVGTPAYMSPEQGQGRAVDARSDVYSLGVVLFEMLTGRVPYEAETPMGVVIKHITAPVPRPRGFNPALPEPVERVILRAMAKEPFERFGSAGELATALQKAIDLVVKPGQKIRLESEVVSRPVVSLEVEEEPAQRRVTWISPAILAVVVIVSVVWVAFLAGRPGHDGRVLPRTPATSAGPPQLPAPTGTATPLPPTPMDTSTRAVQPVSSSLTSTPMMTETPVSVMTQRMPTSVATASATPTSLPVPPVPVGTAVGSTVKQSEAATADAELALAVSTATPSRQPTVSSATPTQTPTDTPTATDTLVPTATPTDTPTATDTPLPTPTPWPTRCTDDTVFVADVTVPDNTTVNAGMRFEKIWRVRNGGSCSWGSGYRLAFLIGNRMDGPEIQDVGPVPPGGLAEIGASLVAPRTSGTYAALWQMVNARGEAFGHKLSVIVQVLPPETPLPPLPSPTLVPVAGKTRTRPADGMVMVYVPAGEFQMGSNDGPKDERPVHTIVLDGFWLDRTEVTNAQYHRCVMAGACAVSRYKDDPRYNGDSQPVVGVSWDDAVAYSKWAGARLPTEAEWEFAARGPEDRVFPWGNTFDGLRLNYCDINCREESADRKINDGHAYTAPVGSYPSGVSWCGVLDLAGNVWEWVADWYGAYPAERQINPTGPASGTSRVLRGGSWITGPDLVRCAARYGINAILPADWLDFVGFRCASSSP